MRLRGIFSKKNINPQHVFIMNLITTPSYAYLDVFIVHVPHNQFGFRFVKIALCRKKLLAEKEGYMIFYFVEIEGTCQLLKMPVSFSEISPPFFFGRCK